PRATRTDRAPALGGSRDLVPLGRLHGGSPAERRSRRGRDTGGMSHSRATPRPPARLMGVVNVTPDSFDDGGRYFEAGAAVRHGQDLIAAGADILDPGGESSRPGAEPVPATEEAKRV